MTWNMEAEERKTRLSCVYGVLGVLLWVGRNDFVEIYPPPPQNCLSFPLPRFLFCRLDSASCWLIIHTLVWRYFKGSGLC